MPPRDFVSLDDDYPLDAIAAEGFGGDSFEGGS
jgi:hypothetical protein